MKFKGFFITFLLLIIGGLVLYFVFNRGLYPIAIINSKLLTAKTIKKEYSAALKYYQTISNSSGEQVNISLEFSRELKRVILDSLIENELIYNGLKSRLGNNLEKIITEKLISVKMDEEKVRESASLLYGLTLQEFKDLILTPQATREILEEKLLSDKQNLDEWLDRAKKEAFVLIFGYGFSWEDGKVSAR